MPNSPPNPTRTCDFCSKSTALIFCRPDSAKLCLSCDIEVHSTNPLFSKHTRFLLCDVCDDSPASIFCSTEKSVFCQNCDFEAHSGGGSGHDRRPVEGFSGRPSAAEMAEILGFDGGFDWGKGLSEEFGGFGGVLVDGYELNDDDDGGFCGMFVWDTPDAVFSMDELIVDMDDAGHNFHAMSMGVPPLPKDRNVCSGKHKQEILRQLRELAKSDPNVKKQQSDQIVRAQNVAADETEKDLTRTQHIVHTFQHDDEKNATLDQEHEGRPFNCAYDAENDFLSSILLESHNEEHTQNPDGYLSMNDGPNPVISGLNLHNPVESESVIITPKVEFSSVVRDSAISRYKEKKRARRYDKHIRYESRKVQAEGRTRIKGRFAKDGKPASGLRNSSKRNR